MISVAILGRSSTSCASVGIVSFSNTAPTPSSLVVVPSPSTLITFVHLYVTALGWSAAPVINECELSDIKCLPAGATNFTSEPGLTNCNVELVNVPS